MRDEDLIRNLSADLKPRTSLASSQNALLLWLVGSFLVLISSVVGMNLRPDVYGMLETRSFPLELFSALALGIIAAGSALHLRIPGSKAPRKVLAAVTLLWLASVVYHGISMPKVNFHWTPALHCAGTIVLMALVPGLLLYGLVRRGATTEPKQAFAIIALAMTASAAAFLPLVCGNDSVLHLIFGHASPYFLLGFLFYQSGRYFLKW